MSESRMDELRKELEDVGEHEFRLRVALGSHWGMPHGPKQKAAEAIVAELDRTAWNERHDEALRVAKESNKLAQEANTISKNARIASLIAVVVSVVVAALTLWPW